MRRDEPAASSDSPDESRDRVPVFGTWRRAYGLAMGLFAIEIALLYAFTRYFS